MKILFTLIVAVLFTCSVAPACLADDGDQFIAIAYHDVVRTRTELASDAITVDHLIDQFEWLLANDYHPVSIDDLLAARAGKRNLPRKAVLLCWDDGYASFYTLVFPLLKAYNFPAVLALEGSWIAPEPRATVRYGKKTMPRNHFLSWKQLRELAKSPLVEIASHSFDLHHGVLADGFGDRLPAVIARKYDPDTKRYESDKEQFERIYKDLQKNSRFIESRLGVRPRVMVWPFGRYNKNALDAARKAGMEICLTLNPVPGTLENLQEIGRMYPTLNPGLDDYRGYLDPNIKPPVRHFFRVDSRQLLDASPDTEEHFSLFLNRLKAMRPAMVVFSPVVEKEDGLWSLFPNRFMPMFQDRLARFSWHIAHRGGSSTYLWLPSALFTSDIFTRPDEGILFFEEMGKFAYCDGVLVEAPELVRSLFAQKADTGPDKAILAFWDPARRKMARSRLRKHSSDPKITAILARLAALQHGQPFLEMGLVLPLARLPELDMARATMLLRYFDFLVVDARAVESVGFMNSVLENLTVLTTGLLTNKMYVLFQQHDSARELAGKFSLLPRYNIINWGYEYDDFLARRPDVESIRKFVSDAENPFE